MTVELGGYGTITGDACRMMNSHYKGNNFNADLQKRVYYLGLHVLLGMAVDTGNDILKKSSICS